MLHGEVMKKNKEPVHISSRFIAHHQEVLLCTRGTDKSLTRLTSRFILFDGENISFDASLVTYI
jgi:hypothetical protein